MTDSKRSRIAANPIPYWLNNGVVDKSKVTLSGAFHDLAEIGFTAVKADVPVGMSTAEYREWVSGYGLAPAVSLYNSTFDSRPQALPRSLSRAEDLDGAKSFAAQQLELGLDSTMLCAIFVPERLENPGVGAAYDEGRFQTVMENVAAVAGAIKSEGVQPLLHSHVGGWIETEHEVRTVLDTLGPDLLGFGPDTGHLTWAGADTVQLVRDYADRIGAIHIKDVFPDYIDPAARKGRGYWELAATKRFWAEPGSGVVDLKGVLDAIPADYTGDYMIEVDVPSVESKYESLKLSYEWASNVLGAKIA